ncbi:MAG: hypothetical protein P1U86_05975 [Verrucomicrobiales bacterium]|nr:hypothetical protein [Verrucomicrobiales bacterium]
MRPSPENPLFGGVIQLLSQIAVCGYLIWLAVTDHAEGSAAEKVDEIIFVDFLGYFLLSFLFTGKSEPIRWEWPVSSTMALRFTGYLALVLVFVWFLEGAAGWPVSAAWGLGILASLSHVQRIRTEAILRVVWAIISAFLAALTGSILGVKEENLLVDHLPTLLGWGLLYFGGVVVSSLFFRFGDQMDDPAAPDRNA